LRQSSTLEAQIQSQENRKKKVIKVPSIEKDHFKEILDFMYTGRITIEEQNAIKFLGAATYLNNGALYALALPHFREHFEQLTKDTIYEQETLLEVYIHPLINLCM
jgi:hypothetical protein